jgi:ATP/maltotriose-dependent transcriptional regulator MalT
MMSNIATTTDQPAPGPDQLVDVAAVFGATFSIADVADVMGEPVGRLLAPLAPALDDGLIVGDGDMLRFRDETSRDERLASLPPAVRAALHRDVGRLLLARPADAQAGAVHLVASTMHNDAPALAELDRSATQLIRTAPQAAAQLALRALELTGPATAQGLTRTVTAVKALLAAGRHEQARDLAATALAHPGLSAVDAAELRLMLSSLVFMDGRSHEAVALLADVIAEDGLPAELYGRAELGRLRAVLLCDDVDDLRSQAEAILAGSARDGGDEALGGALVALAMVAWREGRPTDALGLLDAAVRRMDRMGGPSYGVYPRYHLGDCCIALGEFEKAKTVIRQLDQEIELVGDTLWTGAPHVLRARLALAGGRLDDAVASARTVVEMGRLAHISLFDPAARWVLAAVAVHRGDPREAARELERCVDSPAAARSLVGCGSLAMLEARIVEVLEDSTAAYAALAVVRADAPRQRRLLLEDPSSGAWLARNALAVGDRAAAEAVADHAERLSADNPALVSLCAAAGHARGLVRRDAHLLREAASHHQHPWARASAFEDAGMVLADSGHHEARASLRYALSGYRQAGADRDAARVRARLRSIGLRHRHSRRVERPVAGWASLTEAELRVADVVAEGITNAQAAEQLFLSIHTIDFHLRHVFGKLGISSRVELARMAVERDANLAAAGS